MKPRRIERGRIDTALLQMRLQDPGRNGFLRKKIRGALFFMRFDDDDGKMRLDQYLQIPLFDHGTPPSAVALWISVRAF